MRDEHPAANAIANVTPTLLNQMRFAPTIIVAPYI
jgi:hypothetical protein